MAHRQLISMEIPFVTMQSIKELFFALLLSYGLLEQKPNKNDRPLSEKSTNNHGRRDACG